MFGYQNLKIKDLVLIFSIDLIFSIVLIKISLYNLKLNYLIILLKKLLVNLF